MIQPRTSRILVANDQEWSARSIESILVAEGYQVERAYTGHQALRQAADNPPDFVILDLQLPDIDGLEVCRRLRDLPAIGSTTPIVITTASVTGRTRPIEALTAGAWDFFGQPIDGVLLLLKLKTFLAAKHEHQRAKDAGALDQGTGLYSAAGLAVRAREALAHARRKGQPLACVAFRPLLPELENAVEKVESLANSIGTALRQIARSADSVARTGPLTFVVLAPATGPEGAVRLADRLSSGVTDRIAVDGSGPGSLRLQTGYIVAGDGAAVEPDDLLRQAVAAALEPSEFGAERRTA